VEVSYRFRRRGGGFLTIDGRKALTENDLRSTPDPVHSFQWMRGHHAGCPPYIANSFLQSVAARHRLIRPCSIMGILSGAAHLMVDVRQTGGKPKFF
jgi:hypothetical protein